MFKPHGWILGARLSNHTEDVMSSVVFDAAPEFVMLIRTRSVLFSKRSVFVQKEEFLGLATAQVRTNIFCADTFRHRFSHMLNTLVKQSFVSDAYKYQ